MSAHVARIVLDGSYFTATLTCHAPADSHCHAVYTCDCESWTGWGIEDGKPWHVYEPSDGIGEDAKHFGEFNPASCNEVDWFDNSDDVLSGEVDLPVVGTWEGDYMTFRPEVEA